MSIFSSDKPITLDFHTHRNRYQGNPDIVEIVSFHLGKEVPNEGLYTIGKHPWWTETVLTNEEVDRLKEHFNRSNCMALGEMGLDKLKGPPMERQIEILRSQLRVASTLKAPVIIHCVRAYHHLLHIKNEFPEIKRWCIHGFGRNATLGQQLVEAGFFISLMPQPHDSEKYTHLLRAIPVDRLFLETDSMPDVSIENIYLQASAALGISLKKLQKQLVQNANNFFDHELVGKDGTVNR